jgi:predicted DNA-binding WGR domain protein
MFDMPTQLIDYRCALEAVDRDRNIARAYRIEARRDLFGHTIVDLRWGRIGRRGAGLTVSFSDEAAARRSIQRALAKRASAERRIGVAYGLVNAPAQPVSVLPFAANEDR